MYGKILEKYKLEDNYFKEKIDIVEFKYSKLIELL
jgi:hypothetical protein